MRLITVRSVILGVAARWHEQYPDTPVPRMPRSMELQRQKHLAIGVALDRLDLTIATAAEINALVSNDSWTRVPECTECGRFDLERVLLVGDEPDYESHTVYLCEECAVHAVECFVTGKDRPRVEPEQLDF